MLKSIKLNVIKIQYTITYLSSSAQLSTEIRTKGDSN